MKKFFSVLFASAFALMCTVAFNSCSNDDDDEPADTASIVGVWQAVYAEWWEKENGKVTDKGSEPEADGIIYEFHANGKVDIYDDLEEYNSGVMDHTADWKINGNKLVITDDGEDEVYTIESLKQNSLELSYYEKDVEDGVTYEDYYKTTYKRLK